MPDDRNVYHVLPNGKNGWKAEIAGNEQVLIWDKDRERVVEKVKELARKEKSIHSQVVVYKSDGTLQPEIYLW